MKRDYLLYIKDILDSINRIEEFIGDMDYDDFVADDKTSSAVIHKLEIMGEASKNVSKDIKVKHKQIPWNEMARMRDKITHFYFGVDYEIVWKVVKENLPLLKDQIKAVLDELSS
ncbi:MAG: DUF86 domain-containing protein [Actinomycetota bacterium]|nr:DUF86 domain-containing protein [Actinomycetota bacterium]